MTTVSEDEFKPPKRCRNGHAVPADADFCPECGERYDRAAYLAAFDAEAARKDAAIGADKSPLRWSETTGTPIKTRLGLWLFDRVRNRDKPVQGFNVETGEMASVDWCRFRGYRHCYVPVGYSDGHAGDPVGPPADRGFCALESWDDQRRCSQSEPGPDSHEVGHGPQWIIPFHDRRTERLPRHITPPWIRGGRPV